MPGIVDDLVYFLERQEDGKFCIEGEHLLADLGYTVPGFGDRITLAIQGVGASVMEVVGRHFVRHIDESTDSEWLAWFIIVQAIDPTERDDLFDAISGHYSESVRGRSPPKQARLPSAAAAPQNERNDFEWWQEQDKQRQKHHPRHKLDKPQMRVLRFLSNHPECMTVDLIPQCGEKTMEALAKVGCVRPGGKDRRGAREWLITDEGHAELKREDTYKNWTFR